MLTEKQRLRKNELSNQWKQRNPERTRAAHKRWVALNQERRKSWRKAYDAKRKEYNKEYDRLRYLRPENIAKRERLKSKKKEYMRLWIQNNRDKHRLAYAKRRALKRGNGVGNSRLIASWIRSWQSKKRIKCYWCGRIFPTWNVHVDHITPLNKGGLHSVENLCVACQHCNMRKHDKSLHVWNEQIAQPVLL